MGIYCDICKVNVEKSEWNNHIYSEKHRRRLFRKLPKDYSEGEEYKPIEKNDKFTIREHKSKYNKKFKAWQIDYRVPINPNVNFEQINEVLDDLINTIKKRTSFRDGDKIDLTITNGFLHHPISSGLKTIDNDNSPITELGNHISNILTSNEQIALQECNFHVTVIAIPQGQGGGKKIINLTEDKKTKRCITTIKNSDNLCCPRGVVTALTYHGSDIMKKLGLLDHDLTPNEVKNIRVGDKYKMQKQLANKLLEICNIPLPEPNLGLTLESIKKIEEKLDIQINIICAENFNTIIHSGPDKDIKIYLYKNKNHFDVINSMTAFFGSSYYCHKCKTSYDHKDKHKCKQEEKVDRCNVCNGKPHTSEDIENRKWLNCDKCFRWFYNEECFKNHRDNGICETIWKCKNCQKILQWKNTDPDKHRCGEKICLNCKKLVMEDHKCYMQKKFCKGGYCEKMIPCYLFENKKNDKCYSCKTYNEKYLFFDIEAMQETDIHIPNLVVVHDFDGKENIFENNDELCNWLISKKHSNYTAIAHNAKGYDSQFILKYCVENTLKPYTIYNGTKLMLLEIECLKLKIIDSMNFVAQPLSSFPKTFGLTELKKGYFPHYFNKEM
jgi:hypothetical protein